MAYRITFTPRFQKHFKDLTAQEKKLLKSKLELLAENPAHPSLRTKHIQGMGVLRKTVWPRKKQTLGNSLTEWEQNTGTQHNAADSRWPWAIRCLPQKQFM